MAELRASILVNLAGNLERMASRFSASLSRVGTVGRSSFGMLDTAASRTGASLSANGARLAMLATGGLGMAALMRGTMTMEKRLAYLGINAKASREEVSALWRDIQSISGEAAIRIDPQELLSAQEQVVSLTGDMKFAAANARNMAVAIAATGASGSSIGALFVEFQKLHLGADQLRAAMEKMAEQGKEGGFTFSDFAAYGPRLFSAYVAAGGNVEKAAEEIGASMQIVRSATSDPAQASTAFEAMMRIFGDREKVNRLMANGIQVFDPEERARTGREVLRPLPDLMREMTERAGGRMTNLSMILDSEAQRAFNSLTGEFRSKGKITSFDHFMSMSGAGQLTKDAQRAADTLDSQTSSSRARVVNAIERGSEKPLHDFYNFTGAALEGKPGEAVRSASSLLQHTVNAPILGGVDLILSNSRRREAESSLRFTQERLRAEQERQGILPGAPVQGKLTIQVEAAPGTSARVVGRPEADGFDMDVNSGMIMRGP